MKFSIVTVLSLLCLCLSTACENHGHPSHSHEPEDDSTTASAHHRLGEPLGNIFRPGPENYWSTKWSGFEAFKASGARYGTRTPTDREINEIDQKVADWVQQNHGNMRRLETNTHIMINTKTIKKCVHEAVDKDGSRFLTESIPASISTPIVVVVVKK